MARIEENKLRKDMYQAHKFIAKNLRLLRTLYNIRQNDIADYLHISRSCYCKLEAGGKVPDFETIYLLSLLYDVSLDYLLSFDITEQLLSMLRINRDETQTIRFLEKYLQLSHSAKGEIQKRVAELTEQEEDYNKFPWRYGDLMPEQAEQTKQTEQPEQAEQI